MEEVKTYSLQEIMDKTKTQRTQIEKHMDSSKEWHWTDGNVFMGQKRSVRRELWESLHKMPLRNIVKEALMKSGTTGIAGAAYLIPDKVHDILIQASKKYDIAPLISMRTVTEWEGGDLKVDIAIEDQYKAKMGGGGGSKATSTVGTEIATLKPQTFSVPALITSSLIEDSQWDLVEWHIAAAGKALAEKSAELAIASLDDGDGDGTLNSVSAGSDTTSFANIMDAFDENSRDLFVSNTLLITPEAWNDSVARGDATSFSADGSTAATYYYWKTPTAVTGGFPLENFDCKLHNLDVLFSTDVNLHASGDAAGAAFTACVTYVFDRTNALLTGRKRWLAISNYTNPINDLAGAVISARQDSVTIYDDAICKVTET